MTDDMVSLPREDFKKLLEEAAETGAKKAIEKIGLTHEEVAEIKSFFDAWKAAKTAASIGVKEFFYSIFKWIGKLLGGGLIIWLAFKAGINITELNQLK